ncbi:MAG TPA: alpha/beta hydrolase [Acidimicrobiales bacterium]|nr:alpha/beta hydrolase [Acidimicrobiales bacterium]
MTVVLLHGVPETADIWDDVRDHLEQPSIALRLPGFGCARPDGFSATKDAYVDWVLGELRGIDGPIDLVGHDWGGGFTARIGTHYPDAVRSWTIDVAGVIHPDYVWHDFAQIWQTPGEGEKFFEQQEASTPEERAPLMQMFGLDEKAALKLTRMSDPVMGTCILDLYRSATPNPHKDWGDGYKHSEKPCMVLTLTGDPFTGGTEPSSEVARVLGAKEVTFETGHFWPLQNPVEGAGYINEFVSALA